MAEFGAARLFPLPARAGLSAYGAKISLDPLRGRAKNARGIIAVGYGVARAENGRKTGTGEKTEKRRADKIKEGRTETGKKRARAKNVKMARTK